MGQVYRATDTKLKRDVALKILPESFAQDPQRMARFQREAEVLASLNHPNIAGIHGLEQEGSRHAIAMKLVEGETLAARISKGAIPLEEALQIALQITEALETAHEKGIIHRDLKPANVIVTPEGTAKVLDFGLAKAMDPATSPDAELNESPTLTMQATQAGIILGTAAYMSPEQAKGLMADQRADIWSFGALLFEMLAGQQPFGGDDITEVLASVVKVDLDWDALPPDLTAPVRRWLRRCLRANPKQRYQAIADMRLDIEDFLNNPEEGSTTTLLPAGLTSWWKQPAAWAAVVAVATVAVLATWFLRPAPHIPEPLLIKSTITANELQQLPAPPVLSPDGRILVYGVANSLWIRYLDQFEARAIPDSEDADYPFFSPDSQFLGYGQGGKLWKLHLGSSARSLVCDCSYSGATWGTDGSIVFGRFGSGLHQVSDQGGDPRPILRPGRGVYPHFLPDQRGIIFTSNEQKFIDLLANGQRTRLLEQEDAVFQHAVYSPSGHLIYRRNGSNPGLYAVAFSLSSLEISGEHTLIDVEGDWPAVSDDQTLSYWIGTTGGQNELVRVDRTGEVLATIGKPQWNMLLPALSPDGYWVAVSGLEETRDRAIWLHDVQRGSSRRLSSLETGARAPVWTAAGDQVAFVIARERRLEIWTAPADSSSAAKKLTDGSSPHFSLDGRYLVFERRAEETGDDLWYLEVGQEGDPKEFLTTQQNESNPRLSPDSRWVAYASNQSGQSQVYVKRFPSGEGLVQISTDRGHSPRWSPDGDELFYLEGENLMVAAVNGTRDGSLVHGTTTKLFESGTPRRKAYAVGEGGETFIVPQTASSNTPPAIAIVHNWFSEFRERK